MKSHYSPRSVVAQKGSPMQVELTRDVIDTQQITDALKQGSDGAVTIFDGIVRNNTRGRRTLDYTAHESMALTEMQKLADESVSRFGVRDVALVHRLGKLEIGETSILIAAASAHRGVTFDACRWLIDTLKKTVPIYKREIFEDGAEWGHGEPFPTQLIASTER